MAWWYFVSQSGLLFCVICSFSLKREELKLLSFLKVSVCTQCLFYSIFTAWYTIYVIKGEVRRNLHMEAYIISRKLSGELADCTQILSIYLAS